MKLWVHALLWLPVVGVGAVSCGDDAKKVVSGAGGGDGGSAMEPSSGGSDVVPPGNGGAGGVGDVPSGGAVPPEAGMGPMPSAGAGGMAEVGGAGGSPGLVCAPVVAMGGAGGDPYGGGEWLDVAAGECKDCPGVMLSCQDLLAEPGPTYDHETGVLRFHVTPGLTQVVSANLDLSYYSSSVSGNAILPAVIDGNSVMVDLSGTAPDDLNEVWSELDVVEDGCGDQYSSGDVNGYSLIIDRVANSGGAGAVEFEVTCNND